MTITTTPLDPLQNSYCDLDDAASYYESVSPEVAETWNDLDPETQERALKRATQLIDQKFKFHGKKATGEQNLQWPRQNALRDGTWSNDPTDFIPSDQIPMFLVCATAALARGVVANANGSDPLNKLKDNFKLIKAAGIELQMKEEDEEDLFTGEVLGFLRKHGEFIPLADKTAQKSNGFSIGRIVRGA